MTQPCRGSISPVFFGTTVTPGVGEQVSPTVKHTLKIGRESSARGGAATANAHSVQRKETNVSQAQGVVQPHSLILRHTWGAAQLGEGCWVPLAVW